MPKSIRGHDKRALDPEWYLSNYPDVANAGFTALEHYTAHGKKEGRYPRLLKSKSIETKLWSGFSDNAITELVHIFNDLTSEAEEKMFSALALARWYSSRRQWNHAEPYVEFLCAILITDSSAVPGYLYQEGMHLLITDVFVRLNRHQEAKNLFQHINYDRCPNDMLLSASNLLMSSEGQHIYESEQKKLDLINKIFVDSNLTTLAKKDEGDILSIDNIQGAYRDQVSSPHKVSILIPVFNAESYIETALRSLTFQTWTNLEIIVVDDASSDRTKELVAAYIAKDSRVILISHKTNKGAYAARNTALKHATGEFVTTHDSDDWSHPEKIQLLSEPLIHNNKLKAALGHWVRVEPSLHFKKPRPDGHLVHASVSTLMFKSDVIKTQGGWDEVKVAADSEMYERVKSLYGDQSIVEVLPGVPLVFARDVPGSLTTTDTTHAFSEFFGLRQIYRAQYSIWHDSLSSAHTANLSIFPRHRSFPAPATNLVIPPLDKIYEVVLFSDFSFEATDYNYLKLIIDKIVNQSVSVAVYHWPDYRNTEIYFISPYLLSLAATYRIDILTPTQRLDTKLLAFLGDSIFSFHPDAVPTVQFKRCKAYPNIRQIADLLPDVLELREEFNHNLIAASGIFSSTWYESLYPDIREAMVNPLSHYLKYGIYEGRSASPNFNNEFYYQTYLSDKNIDLPPLLHYLKFGKPQGYQTFPPPLSGDIVLRKKRRTVLVCGHAAGKQIFGAERSLIEILDAFVELKYNVIVTIPDYTNTEYLLALRKRSHKVLVVSSPLWTQSPIPYSDAISKFREIIDEYSIQAVHTNTIMQREPLIAAKQAGIRSIVHVHEILDDNDEACMHIKMPASRIYQTVSEIADVAIANSQFTASHLHHFKSVHVVSNNVNFQEFDIENKINSSSISIAIISSNIEKKGVSDFIEVANLLAQSLDNARFLIIGPCTAHVQSLKTNIIDKNNTIEFIDYVSNPLLAISQANIIVSMSTCQETFGRTILEGMAARRAVIAYDRGAFSELIKDGETGFLISFKDISQVAGKIKELCLNPGKITSLGEKGRMYAIKNFNKSCIKNQLHSAYNSVFS
ncbi:MULTISPECIES: glycosyltransferase [Pseudomonas]|uniref:glycosyltransferase n=1 Tax=Pseudomonas TaxID=286 RepID=UPI001BAF3986|nr:MULTISPECIES: glycosyltransferase [Pseudomonas]MBS4086640.1 glycosyltransferase [Pseudomonas rustica]MEB0191009.1 glycosyltransferase [Pseudomonas sp. CCI1.1]WPX49367.1 glycosyltransferase [Pseudomonas sp. CCI1.1]